MSAKFIRPLRVALVSLGCPKNLVDSEKMLALLADGQCIVGAPMEQADVIVVNTCGFLKAARDESLGVIHEALEHKAAGRAKRVIVAGCLVNRDRSKLFELAPGIDAIIGVNQREQLLAAVMGKSLRQGMVKALSDSPTGALASDAGRFRLTPRHTAYLRIAEGCSQRCTFCTIPAIRGPFRSKPRRTILAEAKELIRDGAVELNVIAQDTTSYGMDLAGGQNLASLMRDLSALDGLGWLRLMYAYPIRFSDELIDTMASCELIVPYVDLPLQHVADGVLRRMGRRVGRAKIETLLEKMRTRIPGMVIRTTFIVGFPGETDAQFQELLEFVKEFKFEAMGVFEFSPEEGTPAQRLKGQLPADVKASRAKEMMLAQRKIAFAASRSRKGKPIEVLVDGTDETGRCVGRYYGQAPEIDGLCILRRPMPAGTFVTSTVAGSEGYDLKIK